MDISETEEIGRDMNKTDTFCFSDGSELEEVSDLIQQEERMYVCHECGAQYKAKYDSRNRIEWIHVTFEGFE